MIPVLKIHSLLKFFKTPFKKVGKKPLKWQTTLKKSIKLLNSQHSKQTSWNLSKILEKKKKPEQTRITLELRKTAAFQTVRAFNRPDSSKGWGAAVCWVQGATSLL